MAPRSRAPDTHPVQHDLAISCGQISRPRVEFNYTYWLNGEHKYKNQLFITPGLALGDHSIWRRVGVTLVAGYQVAVAETRQTWNRTK